MGDHKGRPYTRTARRRGPRRGDPCGRPSHAIRVPCRPERGPSGTLAVAHPTTHRRTAFPSCDAIAASRADPNEAIGKPARATQAWAPAARRRGPRRGDPRGRPSHDPIAPGGRAVAHLESSTASFPSCVNPAHPTPLRWRPTPLWRPVPTRTRPDPNEAIGKPAWATTSMGDDKRRPYSRTRTARRRGPCRGDPRFSPLYDHNGVEVLFGPRVSPLPPTQPLGCPRQIPTEAG